MDLEKINPKAYAMWKTLYDTDPEQFELTRRCTSEDIQKMEALMNAKLPEDYKAFMLKYYTLHGIPKIPVYFFKCDYKSGPIIELDLIPISAADSTIDTIETLQERENAPVIPGGLMPLTYCDYETALIDLRKNTFGYVWYLPEIKRQRFGTEGNTWDEIGFVAKSLTEFIAGLDTEEALIEKYGLPSRG